MVMPCHNGSFDSDYSHYCLRGTFDLQANKKVVVGQCALWSEIDHLHQRATCEMAKWKSGQNGKGQVVGNPAIHPFATDALVEALWYALVGRNEQFLKQRNIQWVITIPA